MNVKNMKFAPSDFESGRFPEKEVYTMAAVASATEWTRSSSVVYMTAYEDGHVLVFHKEGFQLPAPS